MYERFTDRARKVMQLANQEAQRFNHEYVGTEHILLGLVKEGSGVAANVLKNLDIDLRKVRLEVEKIVQSGPGMVTMGKLPQTPRAKKVIEYSIEEARGLHHNYVGTEHLLLGLLREQEGVAAIVLTNLGLKLEGVRQAVLDLLGHDMQTPARPTPASGPTPGMLEAARKLLAELELAALQHAKKKTLAAPGAGTPGAPGGSLAARLRVMAAHLEELVTASRLAARQGDRIRALERQLVTVRFLLGCVLGAGAGVSLGDRVGLAVGLLAGGAVALVGRLVPALLAGGVAGAFVGAAHFAGDGGAAAGAAVGGLLAACVAEVGRPAKS
jgi:hypothetical protein